MPTEAPSTSSPPQAAADSPPTPQQFCLWSPLEPGEIVSRLDVASRRGRLPGFERLPPESGLFRLELHGKPFDGVLTVRAEEASGTGTRLQLTSRMLPRLPAVFAIVLIATVWPGIYFMDRLIPSDWTWLPQIGAWWPQTWWWYIPLTALPLPFAWRTLMRRSRAALTEATREAAGKIATEIEGRQAQ